MRRRDVVAAVFAALSNRDDVLDLPALASVDPQLADMAAAVVLQEQI